MSFLSAKIALQKYMAIYNSFLFPFSYNILRWHFFFLSILDFLLVSFIYCYCSELYTILYHPPFCRVADYYANDANLQPNLLIFF